MGVETLHLHGTQVGAVTVERVTGEVDLHNIDELDRWLGIDCSHAGGPVVACDRMSGLVSVPTVPRLKDRGPGQPGARRAATR